MAAGNVGGCDYYEEELLAECPNHKRAALVEEMQQHYPHLKFIPPPKLTCSILEKVLKKCIKKNGDCSECDSWKKRLTGCKKTVKRLKEEGFLD